MRIAICDDNKRDTAFLRDIIMQKNESVVIDCYESGADFLAAQQELSHDLVFMDIYLNGENGIDVIRKMREIPSQTEVVFTTVSDEHAVDAFSVRALHYLVKPFGEEDVAECMHRMKNASSSIHEESKSKEKLSGIKDRRSEEYKQAKQAHKALKAKNHAMQQAKELNAIKSKKSSMGAIGSILGSLGSLGEAVSGLTGGAFGGFLGTFSPIAGVFGGLMSMMGQQSGENAEKMAEEKKQEYIKQYLEKKRDTVQKEAEEAFRGHPNASSITTLSDSEKDRIVIARLGVDVEINNSGISDEMYLQAFEKRNLKQARGIMASGEKDKAEMLKALHLDSDASVEDVAAALGGS